MYSREIDLMEDVFDALAGNTEFCTPEGFRCNVGKMEINYATKEIMIDGQYLLSIKRI